MLIILICQHVCSARPVHLSRRAYTMCQHVCSATRVHLSGCAYHVPACAQCYANALEQVRSSCAGMCAVLRELSGCAYHVPAYAQWNTLERVCLSCASMFAVRGEYTGAGALFMCQHVRSATRMHLSGCVYHVPAYVQWNTLERVRIRCASMCAVLCECTCAGALIMCRHVCSATRRN